MKETNFEIRNEHFLINVMDYEITDEQRELVRKAGPEMAERLMCAGEYELHMTINDTMRAMIWQEGYSPSMDNHRFAFAINTYPHGARQ